MKRRGLIAAASLAAAALGACSTMMGGEWVTLIDGAQGLENWNRTGDANWRAADGAIVADNGKVSYLVSKYIYRDFQIRAEFYAETDTNSGIFIRCQDVNKIGAGTCYEVNIWDIRPEPKYGTGAIVDHAAVPVPIANKAGGRWNVYEITAKGDSLKVVLNGVTTVDVRDSKHATGPFALQYGPGVNGARGGVIKWRKVQIRTL
jgi:Domain of Unknown Function (DUF1080)